MPSPQETAYPRFKSTLSTKELTDIYTPTPEELDFAKQVTAASHTTRLGFVILLKTFQRLGYGVLTNDVPRSIIQHLAAVTQLNTSERALKQYDGSTTRKRHLKLIRDYLQLQPYNTMAVTVMKEALGKAALTKQDLADLINVAIEELVRQRFELPAFSTLKRMAYQVRARVTTAFYQQIHDQLSQAEQAQIDALFTLDTEASTTTWHDLKQDPGRPTHTQLKLWIERLQQLSQWQWGKTALLKIPAVKVKHFAEEAKTLNAHQMKRMKPAKRYTLAVAILNMQHAQTLDDLAEIFVKQMQQMHHKGKTALAAYRVETQSHTDELISTLRDIILAYQKEGEIPDRFAEVTSIIGERSETLVQQCDAHLAHTGNNYFSLLQDFYKSHRANLFQLIKVLPLRSSTQDSTLVEAIQFLLEHRYSRQTSLPVVIVENRGTETEVRQQRLDLSWIPPKWWALVTGQRARTPHPEMVYRRHFEVCVFSHILLELKAGDLYIEGSSDYGNYYSQLISWDEYHAALPEYGQQVELPTEPKAFVSHVHQWLTTCATRFDVAFPNNADVDYQRDRLVIRKPKAKVVSGSVPLKTQIAQRIRPINLLDSLIDTELWLNWTRFFKPKSGHDAKLDQPTARYLATAFCYGCNLGPVQAARSLKEFDRSQVSHVHYRHIDLDKLQAAITDIINAYNRFELPKY